MREVRLENKYLNIPSSMTRPDTQVCLREKRAEASMQPHMLPHLKEIAGTSGQANVDGNTSAQRGGNTSCHGDNAAGTYCL